jgi:hypothetical protein
MENFAYIRPATLDIGAGFVTEPKVTDNVRPSAVATDPNWITLNSNTMVFVIDLGSIKLVKRGRIQLGRFSGSNVSLPTLITYQVGDGVTYGTLGTLAPSGVDNTANYYQIDNAGGLSGQFVRVTLTRAAGVNIYVGEIQAWDVVVTLLFDLPDERGFHSASEAPTITSVNPLASSFINASLIVAPLLAVKDTSGFSYTSYNPSLVAESARKLDGLSLVGLTTFITNTIYIETPNRVISWSSSYDPIEEILTVNAELEREGGLEVIIFPQDEGLLSPITREIIVNRSVGYSINVTKSFTHEFRIPLRAGQGQVQIHLEVTSGIDG